MPSDRVEALLVEVWEGALGLESALNQDVAPKVRLKENGDHAIAWRLFYSVSNVYRRLPARYAISRAAHDVSSAAGIGLNTPLTHSLLPPRRDADSGPISG